MAKSSKPGEPASRRPVYVIHSGDGFLAAEAVQRVLVAALGDPPDPTAVSQHDGSSNDLQLADVLDDLRTPSLLSPLRVVLVRDADAFVSKHRESIEAYLEKPCDSGVLVLIVDSWPRTTRLYKRVTAIGELIVCEAMKPAAAMNWLVERSKAIHRCKITSDAARRLVELVGEDCGRLDTELSKLATFAAPRAQIDPTDVDELVGAHRAETVFAIADAIGRNDALSALSEWHKLIANDRDAPYRALGGLAWALRRVVQAKRMVEQGMAVGAVQQQLRIFGEPAAFKRQLERFTLAGWERNLKALLDADIAAKTSVSTTETGVEKLIVSMCSAR